MYEEGLAATGTGALIVGGHTVGLPPLITIAAAAMTGGLIVYRLATRHRRAQARQ